MNTQLPIFKINTTVNLFLVFNFQFFLLTRQRKKLKCLKLITDFLAFQILAMQKGRLLQNKDASLKEKNKHFHAK